MFFQCLWFPPKNEWKQVDLRYHISKVEFLCSFFGGNRRHQKPFRNYLTFKSSSFLYFVYSHSFTRVLEDVKGFELWIFKKCSHTLLVFIKWMWRKKFQWVESSFTFRKGHSRKLLFRLCLLRKIQQWKLFSFHNVSKKNYYEQLSLVLNEARVLSIIDIQVEN